MNSKTALIPDYNACNLDDVPASNCPEITQEYEDLQSESIRLLEERSKLTGQDSITTQTGGTIIGGPNGAFVPDEEEE